VNYEEVAVPAAPKSDAPARELSNATVVHDPRVFVVLLDDLSMDPSRGKGMFMAAADFVGSLFLTDIVGFTTTSTTATVNPTLDHAAVQAMIRHTVGQFIDPRTMPPVVNIGLSEALDIYDGDTQLLDSVTQRECSSPRPEVVADAAGSPDGCAGMVARKV